MHSEHDLQERQRRTNHSESFPLWGATFLHNPWHQGPEARWMPYAPLHRRRRPLREYSFPPIFHKSPRFPCRRRRHKKWRRRRRTSPAQRYYITPEGGALNPPVRRSRSQAEPWQPRAKGPAAGSTLTPVRACQPSGILESTAQVPVPVPTAPQAPEPSSPEGACQ